MPTFPHRPDLTERITQALACLRRARVEDPAHAEGAERLLNALLDRYADLFLRRSQ